MKIGLVYTQFSRNTELLEDILCTHPGISVSRVWYTEPAVQNYDCLIMAGGIPFPLKFPGPLARLRNALEEYAAKGGFILGLGGGFDLLLQCSILPGRLEKNEPGRHVSLMQHVIVQSNGCPGVNLFDVTKMCVFPVSHAAGKYQPDTDAGADVRIVFQYCDGDRNIHHRTAPDGSWNNTAGICSENGRILGTQLRPDLGFFREEQAEDSRLFFKAFAEMVH